MTSHCCQICLLPSRQTLPRSNKPDKGIKLGAV